MSNISADWDEAVASGATAEENGMRPEATSVLGLKLLVYEALSY
jgi:hypothetical protein